MAELAEAPITLQQGQPFTAKVTYKVDNTAIDLQNSTCVGYLATDRDTDTGGGTLLETFRGSIPAASSGEAWYSLTGAEVEALESSVTWANDTNLTQILGYFYFVIDLIPTTESITGISQTDKTVTIGADWSNFAKPGAILTISGSTGNDGNYTVVGYSVSGGATTIVVDEALPDATVDGNCYTTYQVRVRHGECNYERRVKSS